MARLVDQTPSLLTSLWNLGDDQHRHHKVKFTLKPESAQTEMICTLKIISFDYVTQQSITGRFTRKSFLLVYFNQSQNGKQLDTQVYVY